MLVLSCKIGETIHVGDGITITVVDIDRNKVRLGISCAKELPVYRGELKPWFQKLPPPVEETTT
jgi:carbon storage regulator